MEDLKKTNEIIIEDDIDYEVAEELSIGKKIYYMIIENKLAFISALIIVIMVLAAALAPVVAPCDPNAIDLAQMLEAPSTSHLLGTDELGRDILSRIIYGSRVSLAIGIIPTVISITLGTVLGLLAGFLGKKVDFVIMRLADIVLAFPSLLLAMVIMYTLGASLLNIFIALSVVGWAGTARVVRSQTLALKEKEFVEAANSIGVKKWKIMIKHILPNCLPNLIVLFTLNIPSSILSESSLSFLGVGAQPPSSSWGLMVFRGKKYLFSSPWITLVPGIFILVTVLAFNFLGDGVRDVMDPYMKE